MSLIIENQPTVIQPVYSDMWVIVKSTENPPDVSNLRYKFELFVNDELKFSSEQYADPQFKGKLNVGPVLRDYLDNSLPDIDGEDFNYLNDSLISYKVNVTGYVLDVATLPVTTGLLYTFNGVVQPYETWDYTKYLLNNSNSKFLSNWKGDRMIGLNDDAMLMAIVGAYNGVTSSITGLDIRIKEYGNIPVDQTIPLSTSGNKIIGVNVGTKHLKAKGFITDQCEWYEVKASGLNSETIRFKIDRPEYRIVTRYRLKYLNRMGGVDYVDLIKGSTRSVKSKSSTYVANKIKRIYKKEVSQKIKALTDFLTPLQSESIEELLTSVVVKEVANGVERDVIIDDGTYQILNRNNQKLIQYNIDFEMANEIRVQSK